MDSDHRAAVSDVPWLIPVGVVVLLGTWFTNADDFSRSQTLAATLCAALAVAGLFAALRVPRAGAMLTSLSVTGFVLLDVNEGPIYLTLAAAAFTMAARVELRRWVPPAYVGAALVWVALLVRGAEHSSQIQLLAVAGVVTAGGAVGTLVRNRRIDASERARAAAAEEQLRMARDLHDGVGHGLAVIAMQAGVGLHVLDKDPAGARAALEAIRDSARESLDALRAELSSLTGEPAARRPPAGSRRPGCVGRPGQVDRPSRHRDRFTRTRSRTGRRSGIRCGAGGPHERAQARQRHLDVDPPQPRRWPALRRGSRRRWRRYGAGRGHGSEWDAPAGRGARWVAHGRAAGGFEVRAELPL